MATDRRASDMANDLRGNEQPAKPVSEILNPSKMAAEGARQERQQQQDDARRNADGSPIKLSGGR